MTDKPYTDDDLIAEAARQHHELTRDPDFMGVGESMGTIASTGESWEDALVTRDADDEDDVGDWTAYDDAQRAIHDLVRHGADTSEWAVRLGADGLVPDAERSLTIHADERPIVRVLFAFEPDMPEEQRTNLVTGLATAMEPYIPAADGTAPALDRWQRADGFPLDDYFAAVAGYLTDPTTPVLSWHHDEPWEAAIEMAEDGVPGGWDEAHIAWRVDEDCEPTHCDDFTGYGWYLILTRTNDSGQDSHTIRSLNLAYLAEPRDVAQAARTLLGGDDRA